MREKGYNVGGEQSGHVIFSDYSTTGDGLVSALQVLAVVHKIGKPVSEVCHRFDPLPQVLRNVRFNGGKPLENPAVAKAIADATARLEGRGRLVIRPPAPSPSSGSWAKRTTRRWSTRRSARSATRSPTRAA